MGRWENSLRRRSTAICLFVLTAQPPFFNRPRRRRHRHQQGSTYYLLRIRYNWTPERLQKAEYLLHGIPVFFGLATCCASLGLDSGIFDCWIAPFPQGCVESWRSDDGSTTCERGDNASLYIWLFDLVPKWSAIFVITVNMILTYRAVYLQKKQTIQYTQPTITGSFGQSSIIGTSAANKKAALSDISGSRGAFSAGSGQLSLEGRPRRRRGRRGGSARKRGRCYRRLWALVREQASTTEPGGAATTALL